MRKSPCTDCTQKGCGAYHDQCHEYLEWSKEMRDASFHAYANRDAKPHMERSKNNTVFQSHIK